ncbi:hypothetical protein Plhal304r1_c072g0160401 [Plasmopara halstedii]
MMTTLSLKVVFASSSATRLASIDFDNQRAAFHLNHAISLSTIVKCVINFCGVT